MGATADSSSNLTAWTNDAPRPLTLEIGASSGCLVWHDVVFAGISVSLTIPDCYLPPPWTMYLLICRSSRPGSGSYGDSRFLYRQGSNSATFSISTGEVETIQGQAVEGPTLPDGQWARVRIHHSGVRGFVQVEDETVAVNTGAGSINGDLSLLSYSPGTNGPNAWIGYLQIVPGSQWAEDHAAIWAAMASRAAELAWWETTLVTADTSHNGFPGLAVLADGSELLCYRKGTSHSSYDGVCVVRKRASASAEWGAEVTVHSPGAGYDGRDPSVRQLASGRVLLVCHTRQESIGEVIGSKCYYSDDAGATWTGPVDVPDPWDGSGKPEAPPVEVGAVVKLPVGRGNGPQHVGLAISYDEGETWDVDDFVVVAEGSGGVDLEEPNLVVMGDGEHCLVMRGSDRNTRLWTSPDGATWTAQGIIYRAKSRSHLVLLGDGRVLSLYRRETAYVSDLGYRVSSDACRTWTDEDSPMPYNTGTEYAAGSLRSDGTVVIAGGFLSGAGISDIRVSEIDEEDL